MSHLIITLLLSQHDAKVGHFKTIYRSSSFKIRW